MTSTTSAFQADVMAQTGLLRARAMRLTRNPEAADDLVQETLMKGLDCEHQFTAGTNIRAWLYTILRNNYLSNLRKDRLRSYAPLADDPLIEGPGAAEVVTWGREMRAALDRLPTEQRRAVLLAAEGHNYDEIAAIERIAVGTVKSRVCRARQFLREELGEAA